MNRFARSLIAIAGAMHALIAFAVDIAPSAVPIGASGVPYSQTFTGSGGQAPYTFTNEVGRLPNGLTLSPGGSLAGTPVPATIPFEIWVTDADGRESKALASTAVITYPLAVSSTLPLATTGQGYAAAIQVNGGTAPYTCSLTGGAVPTGLTLGSNCGLNGLPLGTGTFSFTVTVTDAFGGSTTQAVTLVIAPPAVVSTLTHWMLLLLGLLLAATGATRRRRL